MAARAASLLLSAALGCAPDAGDPADTGPAFSLDSGVHQLEHGGLERSYSLHRPADLAPGAPLVLAFHGYSSSAAVLQGYADLDTLADREGFAVVYPQGTRDRWGYAYWEVGYTFHDGTVDDLGFARALVEVVGDDLGSDPDRVFAMGMSNGGDLSFLLACQADDLIAAVAPVAGTLMAATQADCDPARPPDLLAVNGTDDAVTWFDGDPDDTQGYGAYLSTEDSVGHFVTAHGLDRYDEEALPDTAPDDGSTVLARRWSSADSDARVHLLQVDGGGHDWPGAFGNQDVSATEAAWAFFMGATDP